MTWREHLAWGLAIMLMAAVAYWCQVEGSYGAIYQARKIKELEQRVARLESAR